MVCEIFPIEISLGGCNFSIYDDLSIVQIANRYINYGISSSRIKFLLLACISCQNSSLLLSINKIM